MRGRGIIATALVMLAVCAVLTWVFDGDKKPATVGDSHQPPGTRRFARPSVLQPGVRPLSAQQGRDPEPMTADDSHVLSSGAIDIAAVVRVLEGSAHEARISHRRWERPLWMLEAARLRRLADSSKARYAVEFGDRLGGEDAIVAWRFAWTALDLGNSRRAVRDFVMAALDGRGPLATFDVAREVLELSSLDVELASKALRVMLRSSEWAWSGVEAVTALRDNKAVDLSAVLEDLCPRLNKDERDWLRVALSRLNIDIDSFW